MATSGRAAIIFAIVVVAICAAYPSTATPDLAEPAVISILWLWLSSPVVAVASGYGVAVLWQRPFGKTILTAVLIAVLLDVLLFPIAYWIVN